jgi:hypothetical protein
LITRQWIDQRIERIVDFNQMREFHTDGAVLLINDVLPRRQQVNMMSQERVLKEQVPTLT